MKRYNIGAWGDGDFGLDIDEYETGEWVRFDDVSVALAIKQRDKETARPNQLQRERDVAIARAEAAEQLAVWVARKGVMVGHDECVRPCVWFDVHRGVEHDGTDADLLRALKEASGIDHSTE